MSDQDGQQETTSRGLTACRKCGGLGFHYLTCAVLRLSGDLASALGEQP
jgi:hypothetical protein